MQEISYYFLPFIMAVVGIGMIISRKDLFGVFVSGAREGIESALNLLPVLIALLGAVYSFNASGAAERLTQLLSPIVQRVGIPAEIVPLLIVRPMSGGASTAILADIFEKYGPDSFTGRCASVIAGSSDTVFYIVSVYFSSISVKKIGKTVSVSLLVMFFCIFASCFLCRLFF